MCGLFGFVSKTGAGPDPALMLEISEKAARRGPDGFGCVVCNGIEARRVNDCGDGEIERATAIIGHCRLATSGSGTETQPLLCGTTWIAHNGNVYNAPELTRKYKLSPATACDSEVLGLLIDRGKRTFAERVKAAVAKVDERSPLALLAMSDRDLVIMRRGHPLYLGERPEGHYFCSLKFAKAEQIPEWPDGVGFEIPQRPASVATPNEAAFDVEVPAEARKQPINSVRWVHRETITPNDYNPNKQPPPEHELLKVSLLEDGWTQPIVVFRDVDSGEQFIVDGEHRWRASADKRVYAMTGGLVPVVFIDGDRNHRMMSTIRHNRARGEHAVLPMADIVRELLEGGSEPDEICRLLQMEPEEVERLAERAGVPEVVFRNHSQFNPGWVPE